MVIEKWSSEGIDMRNGQNRGGSRNYWSGSIETGHRTENRTFTKDRWEQVRASEVKVGDVLLTGYTMKNGRRMGGVPVPVRAITKDAIGKVYLKSEYTKRNSTILSFNSRKENPFVFRLRQ